MQQALLIDIGSTFTKVAKFNLDTLELIARSQAYTTVETGINQGLLNALEDIPDWETADYKLASSSAAGGLKIVASGLVPELTAEAARQAALGAGSRVIGSYSYELTSKDIRAIKDANPDIILLAGGTDGGNQEIILHNARQLAESDLNQPIVIAGNRSAVEQVEAILTEADKETYITENVMPELEKLNIQPARQKIREIFLDRIVAARGFDQVKEFINGVIMPTPSAVLQAADYLSKGTGDVEGYGELIVVDIGGATTDVHSAAAGHPRQSGISQRGLEEPYLKRTVEGDLGMRYSAEALFNLKPEYRWQQLFKQEYNSDLEIENFKDHINRVSSQPDYLPETEKDIRLDNILGKEAISTAVTRHAGNLKSIYTPRGKVFVQEGKDLTGIKTVIGTGGVIVHNQAPEEILTGLIQKNQSDPETLNPEKPEFYLDSNYLLAALGLLAEVEPEKAVKLMKKYLLRLKQGDPV
ncbi:MAG: methylaspartate mutase accessory protein GlmL [Halarsenatibacteraceae bacterium]